MATLVPKELVRSLIEHFQGLCSRCLRLSSGCFEVASLLLFSGSFAHRLDLHQAGSSALTELQGQGFRVDSSDGLVTVYEVQGKPQQLDPGPNSGLSVSQTVSVAPSFPHEVAAGWSPGAIRLRVNPEGKFNETTFLRHELFHEFSFRSCKLPRAPWLDEAGAIAFSGEWKHSSAEASESEISDLRVAVRNGNQLTASQYKTLVAVVARYGWPSGPCAKSNAISEFLLEASSISNQPSSFVLVAFSTGRVLEQGGEISSSAPLGSLMKIPFASSVRQIKADTLSMGLAKSDSRLFESLYSAVDLERLLWLVKPLWRVSSPIEDLKVELSSSSEVLRGQLIRELIGERAPDGSFRFEGSLEMAAEIIRSSWYSNPEPFVDLWQNGIVESSTLGSQSSGLKSLLREMHAAAKTGSVSTKGNQPLLGHFAVWWPRKHPEYLAVFRGGRMTGAGVAAQAEKKLRELFSRYPVGTGELNVRLLSRLKPGDYIGSAGCDPIVAPGLLVSRCGRVLVKTITPSVRELREFRGVLKSESGGYLTLQTDPFSYADDVLEAEGDTLNGAAREALLAVIIWNARHQSRRHAWPGFCDTTHCMVTLGRDPQKGRREEVVPNFRLLKILDESARKQGLDWLTFSKGGVQKWEEVKSESVLRSVLGESLILAIQRQRNRDGSVDIHLTYQDGAERVSCDVFQTKLRLPSCPEKIFRQGQQWMFSGLGEGHSHGLDITRAISLAASGSSSEQILRDAYD